MFQTQIEFRNLAQSDAVEAEIHRRLRKLDRFSDQIQRCRVTVEAPHKHQSKGNVYHVSVDLHLPGTEIVANRDSDRNQAHEDVYVAIRDAVNAAARQLQDYVRVRRGKVKAHEAPLHGKVAELNPEAGYGRISTPDGQFVYFHRNSLLDAEIDELDVGTAVRFDAEPGDNGPQATSVRLIGKHHILP